MPERWLTYRSSDGSLYVDFYFAEYGDSGGWRIYIISPINYRGHPDSLNITHRIQAGGESYPYICWSQRIATYENALAVAALWADVTALYVQGKGTFDEIARKLCR